jgi:hypothetical protein
MDIIAVWLTDFYFFLLSFLPDCGTHCRFTDTLSVNQYLFILCLVSDQPRGLVVSTSDYQP